MSKLDGLKIKECPYAFASFAEKHNALVDMLAQMQGQNGVTVTMAEKNAIIRGSLANSNGSVSLSNVANVVGSTGLLQNVYAGDPIANAWPTAGKYVTASGNVTIDSTGVVLTTTGGKTASIAFAAITQNISLQNIKMCDDATGTQKNMLVLGSALF